MYKLFLGSLVLKEGFGFVDYGKGILKKIIWFEIGWIR